MLGNQSVTQIEERIGIKFPKDIKEFMEQTRQHEADNVAEGKWHCFDIPFTMVCGDIETATKIFNSVKDRASEVKEQLEIALSKRN